MYVCVSLHVCVCVNNVRTVHVLTVCYAYFSCFSVVGLNFDYLLYNITGFLAYAFFNVGMFWVDTVKASDSVFLMFIKNK